MTHSWDPRCSCVTAKSSTTANEDQPPPIALLQRFRGALSLQFGLRNEELNVPSRCGPLNWGESDEAALLRSAGTTDCVVVCCSARPRSKICSAVGVQR